MTVLMTVERRHGRPRNRSVSSLCGALCLTHLLQILKDYFAESNTSRRYTEAWHYRPGDGCSFMGAVSSEENGTVQKCVSIHFWHQRLRERYRYIHRDRLDHREGVSRFQVSKTVCAALQAWLRTSDTVRDMLITGSGCHRSLGIICRIAAYTRMSLRRRLCSTGAPS